MAQKNVTKYTDIKITKLDGRYKANNLYTQFAEPHASGIKDQEIRDEIFREMRHWCWENFGASAELEIVINLKMKVKWCWDSSGGDNGYGSSSIFSNRRIYLNLNDEDMSLFILRWS